MTSEAAVKIATDFLAAKGVSSWASVSAKKVAKAYWTIIFDTTPPGLKVDGGETIVHVDDKTGLPEFFMTL